MNRIRHISARILSALSTIAGRVVKKRRRLVLTRYVWFSGRPSLLFRTTAALAAAPSRRIPPRPR